MLATILALLPKVPTALASLPEFKNLIDGLLGDMKEKDQDVLKRAYALKRDGSDAAHADLQALVAEHTA